MKIMTKQQAIDELISDDLKVIRSSKPRGKMKIQLQWEYEGLTTKKLQAAHLNRFPHTIPHMK